MLAYPITLEDDDGTLLATSPAGPAVNPADRVPETTNRPAVPYSVSTSAQNLETVVLVRPVGRREHLHDRPGQTDDLAIARRSCSCPLWRRSR